MNQETNLIDLIVLAGQKTLMGLKKLWVTLENMMFISFRKWYIVFPIVLLCMAYVIYIKKTYNYSYNVEGILMLYGPTKEECTIKIHQLKYAHVAKNTTISKMLNIDSNLAKNIKKFDSYDIIDVLSDGTPDFIDYKKNTVKNDTLYKHMTDRLCIRFSLSGNADKIPIIEKALLNFFNNDEVFAAKHQFYIENLKQEKLFYQNRQEKLLSLITESYANQNNAGVTEYIINDDKLVQDNSKQNKLIEETLNWERTRSIGEKLQSGTQPVVLLDHLSFEPATKHMTIKYLLWGWIIGCLIAWMIERKKIIYEKYTNARK